MTVPQRDDPILPNNPNNPLNNPSPSRRNSQHSDHSMFGGGLNSDPSIADPGSAPFRIHLNVEGSMSRLTTTFGPAYVLPLRDCWHALSRCIPPLPSSLTQRAPSASAKLVLHLARAVFSANVRLKLSRIELKLLASSDYLETQHYMSVSSLSLSHTHTHTRSLPLMHTCSLCVLCG